MDARRIWLRGRDLLSWTGDRPFLCPDLSRLFQTCLRLSGTWQNDSWEIRGGPDPNRDSCNASGA